MSSPAKVRPTATRTADMPTDVTGKLGYFDRFAARANVFVSRAVFFSLCLLLVLVWLPSYFLFASVDTWQLIINTLTTIVTFLLVALLQNSQTRNDTATQDKLNAVAAGLADLVQLVGRDDPHAAELRRELLAAVGLEHRTAS
jgi:low affinity Fe/Cu permease